jgi:hypothetical protein
MLTIIIAFIIIMLAPHPVSAQEGGTITYGETVQGQLSGANSHLWTFEGTAEDEVLISMSTETMDAVLTLLGPNGDVVATDDDTNTDTDSSLPFTLNTDGTYTIVAGNSAPDTSGTYTLTLSLNAEPEIIYQTEGDLPIGETAIQSFTGQENDLLTLFLSSDSFDPVMTLFDPSGERLVRDDDSGGHFNAMIVIMLPTDGQFTVEIASYLGDGGGPYSLIVTKGIPRVTLDSTVSGEFEINSLVYTFTVNDDVNASIALNSDAFDTTLVLTDQNGALISTDDDSGFDSNALIITPLTPNTTYFIIVGAFEDGAAGPFELVLATESAPETAEIDSITYGDTITATANGAMPAYEFVGTAGDVISITLSSEAFDTVLSLYTSEGLRIGINDDFDDTSLNSALGITLPTDGTYRIVVDAFEPPVAGEFTLSLTHEPSAE